MQNMFLKDKLARGERVFGTFFQYVTNSGVVEVLPAEGLDFVIVNSEHNALDIGDFHGIQFALQSRGIACLARIHNREMEEVAKACDSYPDGVVVPYVEDVEELKRLVGAAKYRPLKGPALEKVIQRGEWPSEQTREYVRNKCARTVFCAMIESVRSMENLEQICAVPGLDAVFIGPNDLTVSMGIPEERDHPRFVEAVQRVIDVGQKHGVAGGAHFSQIAHAQRLIRQGARFIPFSSDLRMIQFGSAEFLKTLRGTACAQEKHI